MHVSLPFLLLAHSSHQVNRFSSASMATSHILLAIGKIATLAERLRIPTAKLASLDPQNLQWRQKEAPFSAGKKTPS